MMNYDYLMTQATMTLLNMTPAVGLGLCSVFMYVSYSLIRFNLNFKSMHVVKCSAGNAKLKITIDDMTLKRVSSYRIETRFVSLFHLV